MVWLQQAVTTSNSIGRLPGRRQCESALRVVSLQKQDSAARKRKKGEPVPEEGGLRAVPSAFSSVAEYVAVFEPLLLEECRAQILRGQDEGRAAAHRARIAQSEAVNQFTFVKLQVDEQVRHHRGVKDPQPARNDHHRLSFLLDFLELRVCSPGGAPKKQGLKRGDAC